MEQLTSTKARIRAQKDFRGKENGKEDQRKVTSGNKRENANPIGRSKSVLETWTTSPKRQKGMGKSKSGPH